VFTSEICKLEDIGYNLTFAISVVSEINNILYIGVRVDVFCELAK